MRTLKALERIANAMRWMQKIELFFLKINNLATKRIMG
jgi:hypothetical protein